MPKSILARSARYQRRALYGVSTLLSMAILLAATLFGMGALTQFHDQQISRFVQYREQVKSEADQLSARLMQFVDLYEGIWPLRDSDHIPFKPFRQALLENQGAIVSGSSLTAVPFSVITDLTAAGDAAQLASLLRIVRNLSAAPAIDARKLGINLSGYIYSADQRFFAAAPALSATEMQQARDMHVSRFIAQKNTLIEKFLAGYSNRQLLASRPFWTSTPGFGDADTVTRIVLPMMREKLRVATIVLAVPERQFFSVFMKNERIPGFFLLDNDSHQALGYDKDYQADRKLFEAVDKEYANLAGVGSRLQTSHKGGVFFIAQKVDGPGWTAVLAFDWRDILRELEFSYMAGALFCVLALLMLWSAVFYFEFRIARPLQRSAARLLEVKQFNRTIIDTLPIGIAVYDPASRRILLQNTVAKNLFGDTDTTDARAFYATLNDDHADSTLSETSWTLSGQQTTYLGVVRSKTRWSGRDVVLIGLVDLNERIASEHKLKTAVADAERANRAKSMFLALMSHEIRTPLHGAIGHLELLSLSSLGSDERARVALINHAFEALLTQVNDILDITKIEAGALSLNLAPVHLGHLIERCAQNFSAAICAKELQFWCAGDVAFDIDVLADEQRITQILQNLLGNAVKFTAQGYVALTGVCLSLNEQEIKVRLTVKDSGIGIPQEQQARIFRALTQADASIGQRYGGTGLGLYLCRDLCAMMGGSISIDSAPGTGSAFHVDLGFSVVSRQPPEPHVLASVAVDLICPIPEWESVLRERITAWGGTVHAAGARDDKSPGIRLYAMPEELPLALQAPLPAPLSGVLHASPAGPLVPVQEQTQDALIFRLTSLSTAALRAALLSCLNAAAVAEPELTAVLAPESGRASSLNVIVAEDDAVSLKLITQQLQRLGIGELRTATNGREALALWLEQRCDLLISDWQMPELDGAGLLQEIRQRAPGANVVLTTALAKADLVPGEHGFTDILHKPVRLADLSKMLARLYPEFLPQTASDDTSIADGRIDWKLFDLFAVSWPKERETFSAILEQRNLERLRRRLHRLQGALLAIGLDELAALCLQIQKQCAAALWERITTDYPLLMGKIEDLIAAKV